MLMYGNFSGLSNILDTQNLCIYNISSLKEGYVRLNTLIPPNNLGLLSGREFDIAYANYILNNDFVFIEFFHIIYCLYTGSNVFLMISDDDWSENLIESLLKLIQQRYGYNGCRIDSFDDYLYQINNKFINDFDTNFGIRNLDEDKERYTYLLEYLRIKNGGPIIIEEG